MLKNNQINPSKKGESTYLFLLGCIIFSENVLKRRRNYEINVCSLLPLLFLNFCLSELILLYSFSAVSRLLGP